MRARARQLGERRDWHECFAETTEATECHHTRTEVLTVHARTVLVWLFALTGVNTPLIAPCRSLARPAASPSRFHEASSTVRLRTRTPCELASFNPFLAYSGEFRRVRARVVLRTCETLSCPSTRPRHTSQRYKYTYDVGHNTDVFANSVCLQ